MAADSDLCRRFFHAVVGVQIVLTEMDQLQRVPGRRKRKKKILRRDQDTASTCPLECARGCDLREDVVAAVRRRWATVLLNPIRGKRVGQAKIFVAVDIVGHSSAFWDRSHRIAGARPRALNKNRTCRQLSRLRIAGKISPTLRRALCPGQQAYRNSEEYEDARKANLHIRSVASKKRRPGETHSSLAR